MNQMTVVNKTRPKKIDISSGVFFISITNYIREKLKMPKTVAVIPAYNEEATVVDVVLESTKYVDEVVVVDDCSTDSTSRVLGSTKAKVIRHKVNQGYGQSLRDGTNEALKLNADYIVTLDADGQHKPSDIPKLVEALDSRADIVIGSRFLEESDLINCSRFRKFMLQTVWARLITLLFKSRVTDPQSGFRGYRTSKLMELHMQDTGMGYSIEVLSKMIRSNAVIKEVPVTIEYYKSDLHDPLNTLILHPMQVVASTIKYCIQ